MKKKIISIIPARGGSKGVPRKNIIPIAGKPLIAWTINASLGSKFIDRTFVSSDDNDILRISKRFGAETIKRPKVLASDKALSEPIVTHALFYLRKKEKYVPDIVVFLQPTSPLRDKKDIDRTIEILFRNPKCTAVISVFETEHSPLKTFSINGEGYLKGIINNKYPFMRRQDLPSYYLHNGAIYVIFTKYFLKTERFITKKTLPFIMTPEKSKQIDTIQDVVEIKKLLN